MSTLIYHDADVDLVILQAKRLAFIGYGNQGAAQAQNLRDNSVSEMLIGNREESYKEAALASGFQVVSIPEAAAWCDVVFLHLRMIAHGYMKNSGACCTTIFFRVVLPVSGQISRLKGQNVWSRCEQRRWQVRWQGQRNVCGIPS